MRSRILIYSDIISMVVPEYIVVYLYRFGILVQVYSCSHRIVVIVIVFGIVKPVVVDTGPVQLLLIGRIKRPQVSINQPKVVNIIVSDILVAPYTVDTRPPCP